MEVPFASEVSFCKGFMHLRVQAFSVTYEYAICSFL